MYRWLAILLAIFFIADPGLNMLDWFGAGRDIALAFMLAFVVMPLVVAQFDN